MKKYYRQREGVWVGEIKKKEFSEISEKNLDY